MVSITQNKIQTTFSVNKGTQFDIMRLKKIYRVLCLASFCRSISIYTYFNVREFFFSSFLRVSRICMSVRCFVVVRFDQIESQTIFKIVSFSFTMEHFLYRCGRVLLMLMTKYTRCICEYGLVVLNNQIFDFTSKTIFEGSQWPDFSPISKNGQSFCFYSGKASE